MDTKNVDVPVVVTRRDDVRDIVHGHELVDPYRWLEDGASPETRAWTREQNERTAAVLDAVPGRERLEALLGELLQVGSLTGARHVRGRFFYTRREGTQDQPILYVKEGVDGAERPLIDPNERGTAGLVALDWWYPSQDGSLLAYGMSANGDEWSVLRVLDVATGEDRDISIPRARSCSVAWLPDNSGFYYTRYPEPGTVPAGEENYHRHVFFHAFGSEPDADPDVFGEQCRPEDLLSVRTDATGRWLVVEVFEGWAKASLHVLDRERPDAGFRRVTPVVDAIFEAIEIDDGTLYALTNHDAPMFRVIARDLAAGEETAWSTIVAERPKRVIETFRLTASGVVTAELESAIGRIRHYGRDGTPLGELPLPGIGGVLSLDASPTSDVVVVGYFSFVQPHTALVYGPDGTAGRELHPVPPPSAFVPDDYELSQVRYPSRDGTLVSMFLVHRKGLARDGSHPLYLTGYGGFNLSRGSEYVPELPAWLMQGGIYALPNLRGGNEYGEAWHRDGMLDRKQNTFDDLIAAAEWLIAEGYTSPQRLAISGRSNGGLLVGAALTQRPDLFRAVLCGVPLLDMVRYHHFRIARLWIPEYGSSDDPEQAEWLLAYSPYHHVEKGTVYPATLITTGEEDSRVDPMHARKMTALLQWATAGGADRPILLRAEANAGHGQGKPLNKRVAESADQWGFIGWQLGLDWSSDS